MANYSYVATDINGKITRGKQSADNFEALNQQLLKQNLYCTSYKKIEDKEIPAKYKYKIKALAILCRQLSSMMSAGVSIVKSLEILYMQEDNKKAKAVLREVYEDVQKGRSLSEALSSQPGVFPNLFVSMIAAGESGGNLDIIMNRVAENYAKDNKINNKVRSAMVYPCILGGLMIVIVLFLFIFIMPMFLDMFDSVESMPPLTVFLMSISDFLVQRWYLAIAIVLIAVIAIRILLRTPSSRFVFDRFILRIPAAGKLLCTIYTSRFARTMANLFASGMQMVDCIEKSVQTLGNSYIEKKFETVVEDVKLGETLSRAIAKTHIFENMFTSIIYVGEESGALDEILEKIADYYDEEADSAITRLTSMLEPLMIIFMGVMVMLVLAGIFPALYGSIGNIA